MFIEKLDYKVDIDRLKKEVVENVLPLGEMFNKNKKYETKDYNGFGGWSLLSQSGDWKDGWSAFNTDNEEIQKLMFPNGEPNFKLLKMFGITNTFNHNKPTQACVGYIRQVLQELEELGFAIRRARVSCLKARSKSAIHIDTPEFPGNDYMGRIHIPIITNKECIHIAMGYRVHMPADGSVNFVWVNNWHQIRNDSDEDRYHIIMDAWDINGVTKNYNYMGDIRQLQLYAEEFQQKIDSAVITEQDLLDFKRIEELYFKNN